MLLTNAAIHVLKECLLRNAKDAIPYPINPASEYSELIVLGYLEAKIFMINNKTYTGYNVTEAGKKFLDSLTDV